MIFHRDFRLISLFVGQANTKEPNLTDQQKSEISAFQAGSFIPLNAELNPICHLVALLGAHHIFHVSGLKVNTGTVHEVLIFETLKAFL
jgi:hypothetical protein